MRKMKINWLIYILAIGVLPATTACDKAQAGSEDEIVSETSATVKDNASEEINALAILAYDSTQVLTDIEDSLLLAMKEEEKLARDVYTYMYEMWGSKVFQNIAASEQRHLDAVLGLMNYYNLPDTIVGEPGIFMLERFTTLYNDLVTMGSASQIEAFTVGALIEDMDIYDLNNNISLVTNTNIQLVFENLRNGSYHHLQAFTRQLTARGITYTPVYISQEEYELILANGFTSGNNSGCKR